VLATTLDHDGRVVVLTAAAVDHIVGAHGEMASHLEAILRAVEHPTERRPGRATGEQWYFLAGAGPARWLHVVVHFFGDEGFVTTAFGRSRLP
jgi:hypothetical protein